MLDQLSPRARKSFNNERRSIKKSPEMTGRMAKVVKDIIDTYSPKGKEGTFPQGSNDNTSPRQRGAATSGKKTKSPRFKNKKNLRAVINKDALR